MLLLLLLLLLLLRTPPPSPSRRSLKEHTGSRAEEVLSAQTADAPM